MGQSGRVRICRVISDSARQSYPRREACRKAGITERQLRSWEKQGLVATSESYGFAELLALRTLAKLRKARVSTVKIRKALAALREKLSDVETPLVELKFFSEGKNVRVQLGRQAMEPVSGQLLLDIFNNEMAYFLAPGNIGSLVARKFDISRQAVNKHIRRLIEEKALSQRGNTRNRTYILSLRGRSLPKAAAGVQRLIWRQLGPVYEPWGLHSAS